MYAPTRSWLDCTRGNIVMISFIGLYTWDMKETPSLYYAQNMNTAQMP